MRINDKANLIFHDKLYCSKEIRNDIDKLKCILYETNKNTNITLAVALPRSVELIISILTLLEAGITFLLIDMTYPRDRIEYMLNNAGINNILTNKKTYEENEILQSYDTIFIDCENVTEKSDIYFQDNEIAYILYTSGSTGYPKAVEVTKRGLNNFFEAIPEIIDFSSTRRIACFTSFTFDIFFLEAILSLIKGLTVILADESEQNNPSKMSQLIEQYDIDMIQMTPSRLKLLYIYDKELTCLQNMKIIMIGGEQFPSELLKILQVKTNARIYNMYGPTETTIWSTIAELTNESVISIGYPIKNTKIHILDENLHEVKTGEVGEICISGEGLAKGYINNICKTNENFVDIYLEKKIRIYRTGDYGQYDQNGRLLCLGRKDDQIKLLGHRIELNEIDNILMRWAKVITSVTCYQTNENGGKLITYYQADNEIDSHEFIIYLKEYLPSYMIPHIYQKVPKFIYTSSGKIDRKSILMQYSDLNTLDNEDINEKNTTLNLENQIISIIKQNTKMNRLEKF